MRTAPLFDSFFLGGFECSTHRLRDGRRLDVIHATRHDELAARDYARLREAGICAARDAIRWHLIEATPGRYDFSSALPMIRAARDAQVQIIWDLFHYGWPDGLNIFGTEFVDRLAGLAAAFCRLLKEETGTVPFIQPVNEISFFSWAAGSSGAMNSFARGRGAKLKRHLVRAAIAACEAIWAVDPRARIVHTDPIINVVAAPTRPSDRARAAIRHESQFEAWDMIAGRLNPELGGHPKYLDVIGVNYYIYNQWYARSGAKIAFDHPDYRPLRELLRDVSRRYKRPLFIGETGIENEQRPTWLRWVCDESRAAMNLGVPLEGICLYPILNHPGWADDRHVHNGLWDYADDTGQREIYEPLAAELREQQRAFARGTDCGVDFAARLPNSDRSATLSA